MIETRDFPFRRRLALALALALAAPPLVASDADWQLQAAADGVPRLLGPAIDLVRVEREDEVAQRGPAAPVRYAIAHPQAVSPQTHGLWDAPHPGLARWRLRIALPEALSINLGFTKFALPPGAVLRVRDARGKAQFRDFTAADNEAHGELWTPPLYDSEILLELEVPAARRDAVNLLLGSINHGYRVPGIRPSLAKSGSCNVDVVCPAGDDWRDQIRSSAVISTGGSTFCSGAAINNARFDGTPYFLTANHCSITAGNAASLVTFWNFENSTCRAPGSGASGGAGDGSLTQFNTGAIFRAAHAATDFTLVELDDPLDPAHEVFLSGWDRRSGDFASVVAIHHPSTDEKRISFEYEATTTTSYLGDTVPGTGTHIRVADWDLGTTEPGSSGSPLYSPEKRIIGQLHGGYAACGNDEPDWYGRLSGSWTGGGTNATRLSVWLDPDNSGAPFIEGSGGAPFTLTTTPANLLHCVASDGNSATATVQVGVAEPGFDDPVSLSLAGVPASAGAGFATNPVIPGGSSLLTLDTLALVDDGSYVMTISASDGMDQISSALNLTLAQAAPDAPVLQLPLPGASGVLPPVQLQWAAVEGASSYLVEVFEAAAPATAVFSQVVGGTSVVAPDLQGATAYEWRVTANNACGGGAASSRSGFTTAAITCSSFSVAPGLPIGPNGGTVTQSPLVVGGLGPSLLRAEVTGLRGLHTWSADLDVSLVGPGGTPVLDLFNDQCSDGDNFHLTLADDAAAPIACPLGNPAAAPQVARPANPLAAFEGRDPNGTWTLRIVDDANGDGGTLQSWGLSLCTGVADSTDAVSDAYALDEDALDFAVAAPGVLANDSTTSGTLSATLLVAPGHGTLDTGLAADGSFAYTPAADFCGEDQFTYRASADGRQDDATVTLVVACVNDLPLFQGLPYAFSVDEAAAAGTAVGTVAASDVEGEVTFAILSGNIDGAFAIDPASGAITVANRAAVSLVNAPFALRIQALDSDGATAEADVAVQVDDINQVPVATPMPDQRVTLGAALDLDAAAQFSDPDGDALVFTMQGHPAELAIDAQTGRIQGEAGTEGIHVIDVHAHDPSGAGASMSFTLQILPVGVFDDGFED